MINTPFCAISTETRESYRYGGFTPRCTPKYSGGSPTERSEGKPDDSPTKSRSSAERIVDDSRKIAAMSSCDRVFTDSEEQLKTGLEEVADYVRKHSLALKLTVLVDGSDTRAEGQAFLIETERGMLFATVKHNFCNETNKKGQVEECSGVGLEVPSTNKGIPFNFFFNLLNWDATSSLADNDNFEPSLRWKYGRELELLAVNVNDQVLVGWTKLSEEISQENVTPFKTVGPAFEITAGMRVGIIACSCFGLAANTLQQGLCSGDGEEEYNAQHGDVFITVGEITHVGAEHVEYNTNTAPGFSGGAAVLLDNDSEYHMCVLAAHAGYSESKGTNFGFLVAKKAKQYCGSIVRGPLSLVPRTFLGWP